MTTHEDLAMSDYSESHRRHHEYTYRLPTPPRIVVPPPTLSTEPPDLHIKGLREDENSELDIGFLAALNLEDVVQKNTLLEWTYEKRRKAQMVLPWLYLGPLGAVKDKEFLARVGITMVFAVRASKNSMNGVLSSAKEDVKEVASVDAPSYFELTGKLADTSRIINTHVANHWKLTEAAGNAQLGKVLVFCESGNEKSAFVVAAYLMEILDDFDHIKSMQVCQAQRFCVNFDDSIKNCLRSYWDILLARRAVSDSQVRLLQPQALENGLEEVKQHLQVSRPAPKKAKRSIEDTRDEDDDVAMGDGLDPSDVLRFANRDVTPFRSD